MGTQNREPWLSWAVELQSLAQAGLYYGKDPFDRERYQRIREIATEMLISQTEMPPDKVRDLFCCETGYQTPKLDTRAAIFENGRVLLIQEKDGLWAMPGGWVDAGLSVMQSAIKEVKEEAGLDAVGELVVALQDKDRRNPPAHAFKICKVLILCRAIGGAFQPNSETLASGYFALDALPPLSVGKTTEEQIRLCDEASRAPNWKTLID